jgi:hypothetical protein
MDNSYQPRTVLLDEVKAGENYEVVITNFHGGAMVRYRVGDMIRITALKNEKLDINVPQMAFERRADDLIDIAGFLRLTEKAIWQAIENTRIPYGDWTARKEMIEGRPKLHIYIELKGGYIAGEGGMATAVLGQLKKFDEEDALFASMERILDPNPIKVTLLTEGAFANYIAQRRAEGADLAHLKPRHINPSNAELALLKVKVKAVPEVAVTAEAETGAEVVSGR